MISLKGEWVPQIRFTVSFGGVVASCWGDWWGIELLGSRGGNFRLVWSGAVRI